MTWETVLVDSTVGFDGHEAIVSTDRAEVVHLGSSPGGVNGDVYCVAANPTGLMAIGGVAQNVDAVVPGEGEPDLELAWQVRVAIQRLRVGVEELDAVGELGVDGLDVRLDLLVEGPVVDHHAAVLAVELLAPAGEVLGRIATLPITGRAYLERQIDAVGLLREEFGLPDRIAGAYARHLMARTGQGPSVFEEWGLR